MSAFTRAVATLHADDDLSIACTWHRGAGDPVACRGVLAAPIATAFGEGPMAGAAAQARIDIQVADVADIARGDIITIAATAHRVETALRDVEGLTWQLTLSKPL